MLACNKVDRPSKPDNLISEEKMSDILYEVFILNAAKGINKRIIEQHGIFPKEYIYKKFQMDSLQFALSNDYYSYDTKTYERIMEKLKQRIEAEQKKNDAVILKETKTKDSIKALRARSKDSFAKRKLQKPISDTVPKPTPKAKPKIFGEDED